MVALEYRPVPDADIEAYSRLTAYAFRPEEAYEPIRSVEDVPEQWTLPDRRGLYEAGELCCTGAHHWFSLRVRGAFALVPGLSAVSTPPRHRRRGLVRKLLAESLSEYHEEGAGFCVLWPFDHAFYRAFGWATCSQYAEVSTTPETLSGIDGTDGYEYTTLTTEDWAILDRVYWETNAQALAMDRTEGWWRKRACIGFEVDPYITGIERDGSLVGYLIYRIEATDDGSDRRLIVEEYGCTEFDAYRALLRFCYYHDSQVGEVVFTESVDTVLQDLVGNPRGVDVNVHPGPMVRIVEVERALAELSYPAEANGELVFDIADTFVPRNDGRVRLSVTDGEGSCTPVRSGTGTDARADIELPITTLAQLAVGYRSVERAETVGDLEVPNDADRRTLERWFPPTSPYLRERF
jgi:predicted acetyltransferase